MLRGPENGRRFRASKGEAQLLGFRLCRPVLVPSFRASDWDRVVPVWHRLPGEFTAFAGCASGTVFVGKNQAVMALWARLRRIGAAAKTAQQQRNRCEWEHWPPNENAAAASAWLAAEDEAPAERLLSPGVEVVGAPKKGAPWLSGDGARNTCRRRGIVVLVCFRL